MRIKDSPKSNVESDGKKENKKKSGRQKTERNSGTVTARKKEKAIAVFSRTEKEGKERSPTKDDTEYQV